jgi:hypothetical protein
MEHCEWNEKQCSSLELPSKVQLFVTVPPKVATVLRTLNVKEENHGDSDCIQLQQ